MTCSYEAANKIVTITNGFLTLSTYPASTIAFSIGGLVNPSTALTTESFTIETKDSSGVSIDYIGAGVTYTKSCDSPCASCSGSLSTCTSCNPSSSFPYLSSSTCVTTCGTGYFHDSDNICRQCQAPCLTCVDAANKCTGCSTDPYKILHGET